MQRRAFSCCCLAACFVGGRKSAEPPPAGDVATAARSWPDGGGYLWKGSGTPEAITFGGITLLPKGEGGTYCSGFTFAVLMKCAAARGLLAGKTAEQMKVFQKHWYGAVPEAAEGQCVFAMEKLGIGRAVPLTEARPGDFIQLWRVAKDGKSSGHSVVLIRLIVEDGTIAGIEYRSSQGKTSGIGNAVERFADVPANPGRLDRARTRAGRLADGR